MPDLSQLDNRYFVDWQSFNCPFCKRRHVTYSVCASQEFDWADQQNAYAYFVKCHSCDRVSMHLAFEKVRLDSGYWSGAYRFHPEVQDLDESFFYSVPTSYFALDDRIPRVLRELFTEAEGCLKSNFLTGASACARKIVYELSDREGGSGHNYDERVKSLKEIFPHVDAAYFDTLLTIQRVTSTKVHENAYDGWEARHLRLILASLAEVLHEIYVLPKVREGNRQRILQLQQELMDGTDPVPPP